MWTAHQVEASLRLLQQALEFAPESAYVQERIGDAERGVALDQREGRAPR